MEDTVLIKNGLLVSDEYNCVKADVLVQGKRIVRIGDNLRVPYPTRTIDASGLYVSPGFVNIHGHDDFYLAGQDQSFLKSICFQGVTTSVSGNCGISNFPIDQSHPMEIDSYQGFLHYERDDRSFCSLDDFVQNSKGRMTFNMVPLAGHGTLRILANGFCTSLGKTAMGKMQKLLQEFIEQGGFGLSSGLMYMPGTFSETQELIDLINSLPDRSNLLYASHLRGYSDTFLMAVQEAIDIARATGIRVECSHLGPFGTQYKQELREALALLERADGEGLQIGFDTLAYCGGSTTIMAIVPPWFYTDGIDKFLERLRDEEDFFKCVVEAMETYVPTWPSWKGEGWTDNFVRCLGWKNLIVLSAKNPASQGKSLAAIADGLGCPVADAFRKVILEEQGRAVMLMAGVGTCLDEQSGDRSGFDSMVEHPLGTIGIDAIFNKGGRTMPYAFGTFPKIVHQYVRKKQSLTLQEAIRKFTLEPLMKVGIHDRGVLKEGAMADLVVFNLEDLQDHPDMHATHPPLATGIIHLLVNGGLVIDNKRFITESRYGETILNRTT